MAGASGCANLPSGNPYLLGDANLDGIVDGQDFLVWNSNKFATTSAWTRGDFNVDGFVDGQDFLIWNSNKFQNAGGRLTMKGPFRDLWFSLREQEDDAAVRPRTVPFLRVVDEVFATYK